MDLSVINPLDPSSRAALVVAGFMLVVAIIGKIAAGWCFVIDKPTDGEKNLSDEGNNNQKHETENKN